MSVCICVCVCPPSEKCGMDNLSLMMMTWMMMIILKKANCLIYGKPLLPYIAPIVTLLTVFFNFQKKILPLFLFLFIFLGGGL